MFNPNRDIRVPHSTRSYPIKDFVSSQYDKPCETPVNKVILILSTPRSGSTLLCDLIYKSTGALGHEYFQHHGYIQELSTRWGAKTGNTIIADKYFKSLARYRSRNGILCINLHGSHLDLFISFLHFAPKCTYRVVFLRRSSTLDQSISFAIAAKTGAWSSAYKSTPQPTQQINPEEINKKIEIINKQNILIESFIARCNLNHSVVYYEQLLSEHSCRLKLSKFLDIDLNIENSTLKKQATPATEFIKRNYVFEQI